MRTLPHRHPPPPYSWGSAAFAEISQIRLHASLRPPEPAPPSPGPDLSRQNGHPALLSHPQPHTWLALLLVLFRPSCPSPAACPEGRPRLSPATGPGRKNAARRPRLSAGTRSSRLNRCPCHTGPSPGDRAAATPPAGRRGLRTPQPKSPERLGPRQRRGGPRRAPPPLFPRWHVAELTSRERICQP